MAAPFRNGTNPDDYLSGYLPTMSISSSRHQPTAPLFDYREAQGRPSFTDAQLTESQSQWTEFDPELQNSREPQMVHTWRGSRPIDQQPGRYASFMVPPDDPAERYVSTYPSRTNPVIQTTPPCAAIAKQNPETARPPFLSRNRNTPSTRSPPKTISQNMDDIWGKQTEKMAAMSQVTERDFPMAIPSRAQQVGELSAIKTKSSKTETLAQTYNPLAYYKPEEFLHECKPVTSPAPRTSPLHNADASADKIYWETEFARRINEDRKAREHTPLPTSEIPVHNSLTPFESLAPRTIDPLTLGSLSESTRTMTKPSTRRAKGPYPGVPNTMRERIQKIQDERNLVNSLENTTASRTAELSHVMEEHSGSTVVAVAPLMIEAKVPHPLYKDSLQSHPATEATKDAPEEFEDIAIEEQVEPELDDWTDIKQEHLEPWKVLKKKDWMGPVQLYP